MEEKVKFGLSGAAIKKIAILSMLIDHIGAGVLARYMIIRRIPFDVTEESGLGFLYCLMRWIGRIAFPIFCFLLVEGFEHTGNRIKYAQRLFAFCLISEIPFDLLFSGDILEFHYQNVFFTLFIGLLFMCASRAAALRAWNGVWKAFFCFLALLTGMYLADFLHTDYGAKGVLAIALLYLFRRNRAMQLAAGCVAFSWELPAPAAFLPIAFYNGARGRQIKYFFYIFYPAHLLLLYLVCAALGLT